MPDIERLLRAYLRRLGLPSTRQPATAATPGTLVALQRAHLAAIPYDNLAIMAGRPEPIDAESAVARMGRGAPGGYCFHANAAYAWLLDELGFQVGLMTGRLWHDLAHRASGGLLHPVPVVSGLPTQANPGGLWWTDLGLGDGPLDPLPLVEGRHHSGGGTYRFERRGPGWTFRHRVSGSFAGVDLDLVPLDPDEAARVHRDLSTPPGLFTRRLVVQGPVEGGSVTLRGRVLTTVRGTESTRRRLDDYGQWHRTLGDLGLSLGEVTESELHQIFAR